MASRYYNPRLAQSVAAAKSTPYVSLTPAIERGQIAFERERTRSLKQQALELERKKLEAEAYNKKLKEFDDTRLLMNNKRTKAKTPIEAVPIAAKGFITVSSKLAVDAYNQIEADVKAGKITRADAILRVENEVNPLLERNNYLIDNYNELLDSSNLLEPSSINSSEDLDIAKKQIAGDYIINMDPKTNSLAAQFKNDKGELIRSIPLDEMNKPAYKVVDTEAFTTAIETINVIADKAAKSGKSQSSFDNELSTAIDNLNFTPDQVMSIAFDYLAKEKPELANVKDYEGKVGEWVKTIDMDGDGVPGEDEDLSAWAKNQLKTIGSNAYSGYQKDYADKFDTDEIKLTPTQRLRKQETQERIESTKNSLAELSLPIKDGKIDFDSNGFVKQLNKYNSIITKSTPGGVMIKNIDTKKELEFLFDMSETEFKRVILQLAGAPREEAEKLIPAVKNPRPEDEKLIWNVTDYSQYITKQE